MFSFLFSSRGKVNHVMVWHLPFVDALEPSSGHLVPIAWVFLALLEEIGNLVACLPAIHWVYVETRDTVHNDLCWPSLICRKGCQSTVHRFNDRQPECFIKCRLKPQQALYYYTVIVEFHSLQKFSHDQTA